MMTYAGYTPRTGSCLSRSNFKAFGVGVGSMLRAHGMLTLQCLHALYTAQNNMGSYGALTCRQSAGSNNGTPCRFLLMSTALVRQRSILV